jgi:hypothetical protein
MRGRRAFAGAGAAGFFISAARRAAAKNLSTSRMPSMNSRITSVD